MTLQHQGLATSAILAAMRHAPAFLGALLGIASACAAQAPQDAPLSLSTPDHPYVLHVYADLLQVPALVLDWKGRPVPQLTQENFKLHIDSGPLFRPTVLHMEGNEPLDLALVLDASGVEADLLSALPRSPAHGFPNGLLPHDHIGIYAFDCKSLRSTIDTAAAVATAHDGIAHILASPALHKPNKPSRTCFDTKAVWDAVSGAAADLGAQPGRRAIILISDGNDMHSQTPFQVLMDYLINHSISVFVLREPPMAAAVFGSRTHVSSPAEDLLAQLTGRSGGLLMPTLSKDLPADLDRIVALLRSRYILEFPRASNGSPGEHRLDVQVTTRGAQVYTAGISVPVRDASLMNDPTTVPSDTSKMPVQGKAKR